MATETFYKIRNPVNGLFSAGGSEPRWTKRGKVWRGLGPLRLHLNCLRKASYNYQTASHTLCKPYKGCEVVKFEVVEAETFPIQKLLDEQVAKKATKEQKEKDARAARIEKDELATLRRLQRKHPNA